MWKLETRNGENDGTEASLGPIVGPEKAKSACWKLFASARRRVASHQRRWADQHLVQEPSR